MDILREGKKAYHVQLFYGVKHGFAVRGNMDNKHESEFCQSAYLGLLRSVRADAHRICKGAELEGYCRLVQLVALEVDVVEHRHADYGMSLSSL